MNTDDIPTPLGFPCGMCGGRGGVHTPRCPQHVPPVTGSGATPSGQEACGCGLNLAIWQNSWNHRPGCTMRPPAPVQEAGSGRHVQSAVRNLTPTPGMSSELDGGRQAAVEAVARWRVGQHYGIHVYEGDRPVATFHRPEDAATAVRDHNAALSQPGEPT